MTPEETGKMKEYLFQLSQKRALPVPPPAAVRTMAEWEEVQALVIAWAGQTPILREIVRNASKECKVFIVTDDSTSVISSLTSAGIALDSVRFVDTPFNTIWMCDYGPTCVYRNDVDSLYLIDWIYNRPRPEDDEVPSAIADFAHIPIYEATSAPFDWVHTGGNNLQNGMGTLFSSNLVLNENPGKTEAEIDTIAEKFLGIHQYVKFPTLPYDGIHHLDMHMRVINEETIVVGQYPQGISDGPQIEANLQYLVDSIKTEFGHPFNIIRIPMPPDQAGRYPNQDGSYRTYTNAVFVNKTLLVPVYQEKYDTTALRIYRENLPGYNVVGINCNNIIGQLGALHCITKLIGADEPLLIAHSRLQDVEDTVAYYPVSAYIRHRDGIKEASLFYRSSKDSVYSEVPMLLVDTTANIWASLIPAYPAGTEVQYYIAADAKDGKHQVRPIVAPEGYFKFKVLGKIPNQPPTVTIIDPVDGSIFPFDLSHIPISYTGGDPDGTICTTTIYINGEEADFAETCTYTLDLNFPEAGDYFIEAVATDEDGATASSSIHITIEESTAVKEASPADGISFSPNPVKDELNIKLNSSSKIKSFDVYNAVGRIILSNQEFSGNAVKIDFSKEATGMYIVQLRDGEKVRAFKVVKY
jgi:agmatine/peptidylarginine deiminase